MLVRQRFGAKITFGWNYVNATANLLPYLLVLVCMII